MTRSKESNHPSFGYSFDLKKAFYTAWTTARIQNTNINIPELTRGILTQLGNRNNIKRILLKYDIYLEDFQQNVIALAKKEIDLPKVEPNQQIDFSAHAKNSIALGVNLAKEEGAVSVEPEHLLIGIARYSQQQTLDSVPRLMLRPDSIKTRSS